MPITALPTPPLRSDGPATFADRGDTFLAALPAFVTQANALEANVDAKEASAVASAASAAAAAAAAGAIAWVSGTTYAIGDARYSPADMQTYRRKIAGAGTTDPSLDGTNWTRVNLAANSVTRSVRTSNTILGTGDRSTLIDITSGTFTQTFSAAATLASGWFCYIKNSGTGLVTLDPNASELIDGLTIFVMYPGEVRLVQCDGSALNSVVLNPFSVTFTSSGSFTKPPGYSKFSGLLWGGGGGGAANSGGGGGACHPFTFPTASVSASQSFTVAAASTAGGVGNTSTFVTASAYGGSYGVAATSGGGGGGLLSAGGGAGPSYGGKPDGGEPGTGSIVSSSFGGGVGASSGAFPGDSVYGGGGETEDPEPDTDYIVSTIPRGPQIRVDKPRAYK